VDPRRLAVAVACALVVAGAVVLLAFAQRSPAPAQVAKACGTPLKGAPPLSFDLPTRYQGSLAKLRALGAPSKDPRLALALAAAEFDAGHGAAAKRDLTIASVHYGIDDTRITVASAVLAWPTSKPTDVARTLEGIASDASSSDGLPLLERGLVSLWQGCNSDAGTWFEQAKTADPDGYYGRLADDILHTNQNRGYPLFISSVKLPGGTVAARERAAKAHPGSADLQLAYALALQAEGKRIPARAAANQAIAADPTNLDAQVAAIVLGYDKDAPATAVGALGALIKQNPEQIAPVLHLGILLLWIHRTALAEQELSKAVALGPKSRDGRVAAAFLAALKQGKG
jgi:tetratricopeptide (TPR) repeat protein